MARRAPGILRKVLLHLGFLTLGRVSDRAGPALASSTGVFVRRKGGRPWRSAISNY
jgi:hypothetical protein